MDNNTYAQSSSYIIAQSPCCRKFPYIINVKQFDIPKFGIPTQGSIAYSYPNAGSEVVYTFPAPTVSTRSYPITQLVFCSYNYWVKIPGLGNNHETGYVKCSALGFDYESYVDPAQQTHNPQIGTNTDVIFNMWYFPNNKYKGVNYATPLYYQYYNGNQNSKKCTLFASISGLYMYIGKDLDPTTYMNEMTKRYWNEGGITDWLATMNTTADKDDIRKLAKKNLDKKKPMLVGASDGSTDHMVLVVGYEKSGSDLADYLVLDSVLEEFSTLEDFFDRFPKFAKTWKYLTGGYVYGEYNEYN